MIVIKPFSLEEMLQGKNFESAKVSIELDELAIHPKRNRKKVKRSKRRK